MKPRNSTNPDLSSLIAQAHEDTLQYYCNAVADLVEEKQTAKKNWDAFQIALARAGVIATLIGRTEEADRAAVLGAMFEYDNEIDMSVIPPEAERFQEGIDIELTKLDAVFRAETFWDVLNQFTTRVPQLKRDIVPLLRRSAQIARALRTAEELEVVTTLAEQSKAIAAAVRGNFWAANVDQSTTTNLKALIGQAIRLAPQARTPGIRGLSLPEFIDKAKLQGAGHLTEARLETIYRTNLSSAYNDGRADILARPQTRAVLPLVMTVAIRDPRTRPTHRKMNGYVNTIDYFQSRGIVPPCGFNCRCSQRGVTSSEAIRLGIMDENGNIDSAALMAYNGERQGLIDSGQYPDPGFNN